LSHKFAVGQSVLFSPGRQDVRVTSGNCRITRQLPKEEAEYQYHIQSTADGHQRRVQEWQLRSAGDDKPGFAQQGDVARIVSRPRVKRRVEQHLR
jgi:hypothetical protein